MTNFKIALAAIAIAATGATAAFADDTGGNNPQQAFTNSYATQVSQSGGNRAAGVSSSDALVLKQLESGEAINGGN